MPKRSRRCRRFGRRFSSGDASYRPTASTSGGAKGKAKKPFLIHTADDRPLAFAGLWAPWRDPATGDWILSASVVTTAAAPVAELHNRMPAILGPDEWPLA